MVSEMRRFSYKIFESEAKPYNVNIVGWRRLNGKVNHFDDAIGVYWKEDGLWKKKVWAATTRPGVHWLKNPMNPKGTAILVEDQYIGVYALGIYKKYTALKQISSVRVFRDSNRDEKIDKNEAKLEEGLFGIHIHRAGWWSRLVGVSSAGCQVFQRHDDFNEFIGIVRKASTVWGNRFSYTLLDF
jgi:hypothetical protein